MTDQRDDQAPDELTVDDLDEHDAPMTDNVPDDDDVDEDGAEAAPE